VKAASAAWTPADSAKRVLFAVSLALGCLTTVTAVIAGDGNLIAALAPMLAVAAFAAVCIAPTRLSLYALTFLGLAVDAAGDGGPWHSPLAPLGRFITENLDRTIYNPRIPIPLMALVLAFLLGVRLHRLLSGSRIDHPDGTRTASPLSWGLLGSFLTVVALLLLGAKRGGDMQMAKNQLQNFVLLLLIAYLLATSLRGMRDCRIFGALVVVAALSKALLGIFVYFTVPNVLEDHGFVTYHGDSILWACATTILVVRFAEQPVRRNALLCLAFLPVLVGAMLANSRRLVWIELAAVGVLVMIATRPTRLKRALARTTLLALPLIVIYAGVGWNSTARIFAPLQTFRSVQDSEVDSSTLFRDLEDYNLLATVRFNPLLGAGFGHPFAKVAQNFDLSFFKEYGFLPHNSILGLWAFTGVFGFTGLSMGLVIGVFLAARAYRCARLPDERAAALSAIAMVLIYLIQCYGDIGFSDRETIFLVGGALAVASRLGQTTGAWAASAARTATS
jgi:hypothetical protein